MYEGGGGGVYEGGEGVDYTHISNSKKALSLLVGGHLEAEYDGYRTV